MADRDSSMRLEHIEFAMYRSHLRQIPRAQLRDGFSIRLFHPGDEAHWIRIETAAGEFSSEDRALARFGQEFGRRRDEMERRCCFLVAPSGEVIGTTTAWSGLFDGSVIGRIHWVAIVPEFQGYGLAKPLLARAMAIIASYHDAVYLTTQTTSYRAVGLYRQFGFEPVLRSDSDTRAWRMMEEILGN